MSRNGLLQQFIEELFPFSKNELGGVVGAFGNGALSDCKAFLVAHAGYPDEGVGIFVLVERGDDKAVDARWLDYVLNAIGAAECDRDAAVCLCLGEA